MVLSLDRGRPFPELCKGQQLIVSSLTQLQISGDLEGITRVTMLVLITPANTICELDVRIYVEIVTGILTLFT